MAHPYWVGCLADREEFHQQVAGRRVDISIQEQRGQRAPRTPIVATSTVGSIDANLLEKTSASCISPAAADR